MFMSKLERLKDQLGKIQQELLDLDKFRDTESLRRFRRQLQGEMSAIKAKIAKLTQTLEEKTSERDQLLETANRNRSEKMKRTWRYLRAIQTNYPTKLSLRDLRTALRKHRQGLETDIPDVAWRNPSP